MGDLCLSYVQENNKNIVKNVLLKFEEEICNLKEELELVKKVIEQILDGILFRKKEHDLDTRFGYSFDRDNLYNFILNFTSDMEIKVFLEKPYFK